MNTIDEELQISMEQTIKQVKVIKWPVPKFKRWFIQKVIKGPKNEISHDWHIVNSFLERAIEQYKIDVINNKHDPKQLHLLAKIKAYLELAMLATDFAQAWTFVNLADSFLPLVVCDEELNACTVRLSSRDRLIPKDMQDSLPEDIQKIMKERKNKKKSKNFDKYNMLRKQEIRALMWNSLNRKISLRISLWLAVGLYLLIGLVLAITIAEFLLPPSDKLRGLIHLPFISIAILGFFGGGISAFLTTRKKLVDITSYQTLKVYTLVRMLLGAAGSFVVFIAAHCIGNQQLIDLLNSNIYFFLGTGIIAGFSEQLFVGTMEKMADKLDIIGKTDQEKPDTKSI
jgi:hypothetical protein